jgi:hypothetical protein
MRHREKEKGRETEKLNSRPPAHSFASWEQSGVRYRSRSEKSKDRAKDERKGIKQ